MAWNYQDTERKNFQCVCVAHVFSTFLVSFVVVMLFIMEADSMNDDVCFYLICTLLSKKRTDTCNEMSKKPGHASAILEI